ncbi:AAA family ATPase [Paraburkholderia silviterrae]|uniref:Fimbrial protein n=1 Tax=Paraburkholderia silviterrae TaxID=2528715 RepID=A0A4V2ZY75_9BURK|nr:AAA family ATPase [Paraburkholderia silviterrae]TDG19122.1 fimbrial protein [Paraburkholderia silviterrae]
MGVFESNILKRRAQPSGAEKLIAVVADEQSIEVVKSVVVDQGIATSHITTGSLDDAIAIMTSLKESPRYLIVDVTGSTMPISDLTRLAEVVDPSVTVIVVGERNDVGLFRSLLHVGVQDYLVKPLTAELVRRALTSTDGGTSARMGKVLSFVGARGGVGVTTIATALASHLADKTRRRIAYVDLDPYGGAAASMLGISANNGLIELLQNPQRLDQQLINQAFVAQSDRLLVLASELPYNQEFTLRSGALSELVTMLKRHFHYIMLDLPGRAGRVVEEALDASSTIHVVADFSVHSAREAARLCRFAQTLDAAPAITVLLNAARQPVSGRVREDDFVNALARGSVHSLPYEPERLALAENLGEAERLAHSTGSSFATAIVSLANAITGSETAVAREPWYKRLLHPRRAK